ncbi:GNAT family N-acetyltransferase [Nocardioides mangrovicus]|uniref:GNAT family N-acetyltransferase n=1 Tax=Nocardioides mangrovicus TaxID=2478913 RepID=A0A3L8P0D7_9ACTN|nr:GNAT family N-acetyltransferase [Nocardioides mangrovicus]RLV48905.1 GNAT family N-acetyltransferase [Nocardioides mangrovicus]
MSADVSCRIAWADDAPAVAAVQARAWRTSYAGLLPADLLDALDPEELAEGWRTALVRPADARQRVLVALERNTVTGFALTMPATDPDADPVAEGEIGDLTIDPDRRGQGHASRLVQACVDTLIADGFVRALSWVSTGDDDLRRFLVDAGWAPDGAHRELDLRGDGEVRVKQVRLHTTIAG